MFYSKLFKISGRVHSLIMLWITWYLFGMIASQICISTSTPHSQFGVECLNWSKLAFRGNI